MSKRPDYTAPMAARSIRTIIDVMSGRWKLEILFELFGGNVLRFSELERRLAGISQKMLAQQLRQLERDGVVGRTVHPEIPPRVEYHLTEWGQALCPRLDALLMWAEAAPPAGRARLLGEADAV